MSLATLSVDLVAKVAGFEQELKRVADTTTRQANTMAMAAGAVKASIAGLAGIISVSGLTSFVRATIDGIDALNDLKDATGASIENISALEDVAARTGTSLETVGTSLIKFNAALSDAKPGNATSEALRAIGLSADALKQMDPAEALRQVAVALGAFADDGNKARLVQELFGKSLREVAPFLNDLKEQGGLVAKVTAQQAEEAEKLNKQLFEFQKNSQDASRAIVTEFVPALSRLAAEFALGMKYADGFFDAVFTYGFKYGPGNSPAQQIAAISSELERLRSITSGKGINSLVNGDRADADIKKLERQLSYFKALQRMQVDYSDSNQSAAESRRLGLSKGAPSVNFSGAIAAKTGSAEQIDDARRALASYIQTLQGNLDTTLQLTEAEKALDFLRSIGVRGEIPQVREMVMALAEQVDAERELAKVRAERKEADRQMADEARRIWESTRTPEERLNIELARLDELLQKGAIDWDTYARASDKAQDALNSVNVTTKEGKSLAEELGLTFASAAEDALVNWRDLGEVIRGVGKDAARIIYRKSVTEPLANEVGKIKDSIDWKSLWPFANGGIMTSDGPLPLRAYATGGIANSPQMAIYGEGSMPEAFVPLPDGRRIPVAMQGGGGISINQTFHIDARSDQASIMAAIRQGGEAVKAEILRSRRAGGAFA